MDTQKTYSKVSIIYISISLAFLACTHRNSTDQKKIIYEQIDSVKVKYDYELLSKYLVIENYRYKLNISAEEIEKLKIDTISISKFQKDITTQNQIIATKETNPKHFIRLTLPGKEAVIVPTLLKDGTRCPLPENADKYPMLKFSPIQ